jgi:hypothetical protein
MASKKLGHLASEIALLKHGFANKTVAVFTTRLRHSLLRAFVVEGWRRRQSRVTIPHHFGSLISNPKLRRNVTVSSSVRVRPSFSCSLIRCRTVSGLSTIQSGT